MSKPTVIIVPGAWHTPAHYAPITSFLKSKGYPAICKQNRTCGATDPKLDNNDDAAAIRESIDTADGDVVVVMHSYGGVPGSIAASGAKNVIGLIFFSAFVLPGGTTLSDAPKHDNSWAEADPEKGTIINTEPRRTMYHDADEVAIKEAISYLQPQNIASFMTPSKETAWPNLPKIYAVLTDDQILPPYAQEDMVEKGGPWLEVKRLHTSHSPWISHKAEEFHTWLASAVDKFVENKPKTNGHH